jgi:hypothetical protein
LVTQEAFADICRRVCDEHGWDLLPNGVNVKWADGRHQIVELEIFENEQKELVRLFTTIGAIENMTPVRLTMSW